MNGSVADRYAFGAVWDGAGVSFQLYSEQASAVELCLFDAPDACDIERIALTRGRRSTWHAYVPGLSPESLYGYRVHGPYDPDRGNRFNPAKVLVDPYARAIDGRLSWRPALDGETAEGDLDGHDSAPFAPKSVVIDPRFDWQGDTPPHVPWEDTVIYECHVKGLTKLHPEVPPEFRGTFLGLCSEPVVEHLRSLGVTTVELMPAMQSFVERHIVERGQTNYWGYATLGYFAPDRRFGTGSAAETVTEFKEMVRRLHCAGIEVILDVVFNHTAEGNHNGATIGFRGIDNTTYYNLDSTHPRNYEDFTGCGNTLNVDHPHVLQFVMDSLRYWVEEMHVDGFRFDLATTLARDDGRFSPRAGFFKAVHQDPVLRRVKLISEPWDLGPDGYQLGGFPAGWAEWNAAYRDSVRRFWRGDRNQTGKLASRLAGSSDIFQSSGRSPRASLNFVTCHDGFTLGDLVSYEDKHNSANGENNEDGTADNSACNWGVEGNTDDKRILTVRERVKRSMLATLTLSQGVPMLSHGDEFGRTQAGNNNAYCQDNDLSWVDWGLDDDNRVLLDFMRTVFRIRREHPALRRGEYFTGEVADEHAAKDLRWLHPDGFEMNTQAWHDRRLRALAVILDGDAGNNNGTSLLVLMNGAGRTRRFVLPAPTINGQWSKLIDTAAPSDHSPAKGTIDVPPHALVLLEDRGTPT